MSVDPGSNDGSSTVFGVKGVDGNFSICTSLKEAEALALAHKKMSLGSDAFVMLNKELPGVGLDKPVESKKGYFDKPWAELFGVNSLEALTKSFKKSDVVLNNLNKALCGLDDERHKKK